MEKTKNQRRLYRIFLQPRFQLKYAAYFMTIAVSSVLSICIITVYFSMKLLTYVRQRPDANDIFKIFRDFLLQNKLEVLGSLVLMASFYMILAIIYTKRIVGPLKVLVKHVEALKIGDFDHRTTLRKHDDLRPLMTSLNELSASLKERDFRKNSSA